MNQLAKDVIDLMDRLKITKAHYVGISIGGMFGQVLAAKYPQKFDKMLFACTSANQKIVQDVWQKRIETIQKQGIESIIEILPDRWFTKDFIAKNPKIVKKVIDMVKEVKLGGYIGYCFAIKEMNLLPLHQQIPISLAKKILVLAANLDVATPPAQGEAIKNNLSAINFMQIPGTHIINLEQEVVFNKILFNFLTDKEL